MKTYEFIEHTADIVVKAYGNTLEEAFGAAATAMFDILTGRAPRQRKQKATFEVEAVDREGLLVNFLSKLIASFFTNRLINVLIVFGFQDDFCNKISTTSLAVTGDSAHKTFITSHSASDILGFFDISISTRLHL